MATKTKDNPNKGKRTHGGQAMYKRDCDEEGCFFQTDESPVMFQPDMDLQEHMRTAHLDTYEQYLVDKGVHPDEAAVTVADIQSQQETADAQESLPE